MTYTVNFAVVPARLEVKDKQAYVGVVSVACAWCKTGQKIMGVWVHNKNRVDIPNTSHGICPECASKFRQSYKGGK